MTTVWILMKGEDHEGGDVLGVYGARDAAKGAFAAEARRLASDIDGAHQEDDGSVHLHAGCDWLSLTPHTVVTTAELPAGGGPR